MDARRRRALARAKKLLEEAGEIIGGAWEKETDVYWNIPDKLHSSAAYKEVVRCKDLLEQANKNVENTIDLLTEVLK